MSRHFILTLIPCTALSMSATDTTASELEKIQKTKSISIAHRESSIPFSYLDGNKRPIGYAIDLCERITESIRVHLKLPSINVIFVPVSAASRIPTMLAGNASLECGSTTNTAERRKQVDFTIPHYISSARLLVRSISPIDGQEDLHNKIVASNRGSTSIKNLERLNAEHLLRMQIVGTSDHTEAFQMLSSGKVDAFAMDDVLLYGIRAQAENPGDFKVVGRPMTIEPYAIMLPKADPAFKRVVDDEMRRMIANGTLQQLYAKWFLQPIPPSGANLQLKMPSLFRESLKFPTDKVDIQ